MVKELSNRHLKQPEQREDRAIDWSQVSQLHFRTNEQHLLNQRLEHIRNLRQIIPLYLQALETIQAMPTLHLTADQRRVLHDVAPWLKVYEQVFTHEALARNQQEPEAEAFRMAPEQELHDVKLAEPAEELLADYGGNSALVQEWLNSIDRPYVITTSDSHTTAGYVLGAAATAGYDLRHTAVLSFDHHTDLVSAAESVLNKANVMTHILRTTAVPALAVLGPAHVDTRREIPFGKDVSVVAGADLYRDHSIPDRDKLEHHLRIIFKRWQKIGVQQIYPSVDLDGLRLTQQSYTATDYNSLDLMKREFLDGYLQELANKIVHGDGKHRQAAAREFAALLQIHMDAKGFSPYQGIPASWIGRALDLARTDYGITTGVQHQTQPRKLVGDIVEYTPPDYQLRTAKIAKALMTRLIGVAQAQ